MAIRIFSRITLLSFSILVSLFLHGQTLPTGFTLTDISSGWTEPVGTAFNNTGTKMFVWEKAGKVYVCNWDAQNNVYVKQATPVLNIGAGGGGTGEVGNWRDHGMLGFALDPNFDANGLIYVMYVVDRHHLVTGGLVSNGYNANTNTYFAATIGRITRYQTAVSGGNLLAIAGSRTILLGESASTGIPILHESHGVGSLVFAADGTLLASAGDGASYDAVDAGSLAGTYYSQALTSPNIIIRQNENVGALRSQLINSLNGKIIRIDPTNGNGISSNPFYNAASPRSAASRVWALGLRNPFRFLIKPNTGSTNPATGDLGEIFVNDVGWSDKEELNILTQPASNCGWPFYEGLRTNSGYDVLTTKNKDEPNPLNGTGSCTQDFFTFRNLLKQATADNIHTVYNPCDPAVPITTTGNDNRFFHHLPALDWDHNSASTRVPIFNTNNFTATQIGTAGSGVTGTPFKGICASGGCWYTGDAYPQQYNNTFFLADLWGSSLKNFGIQFTDHIQTVSDFSTGYAALVHVNHNPLDDCLYITDVGDQVVRKIGYGGNRPPKVKLSADLTYGVAPFSVNFTGGNSFDPDGDPITFSWNFGDATALNTTANPTHSFSTGNSQPKKFVVKLTVKDNNGGTSVDSIIISANNTPPSVAIISPVNNSTYVPGSDTAYTLEAVVSDAEHNTNQLSYQWQTILRHNTHQHTEPIDTDKITTSVITRIGCNGDNYYWFIRLTVTDAAGLSTTDSSKLYPICGGPLPLKLNSFSVTSKGQSNILDWVTSEEVNLDHFEIERSYNATSFEKVGTVGAQPGGSRSSYSFTDHNFLDGYIYYRLKMIDKDGKYSYSYIVRVFTGTKANTEFTISPNPFNDGFLFAADFKVGGKVILKIIDAKGAVVKVINKVISPGFNSFQVEKLGGLSDGVYYLEVIQGAEKLKTKLIKTH